jgi:hypothetical protein
MIKAIAEVTERAKTNTHRLDELSDSMVALNKMATSLEVLATKQNVMAETVHMIDNKVSAMESRPMRRLGAILGYIIAAASTAVAGAFVGHFM